MRTRTEKAIILTALLGVVVAGYALTLHYDAGSSICDINARFSCDTVNQSRWSNLLGIPVALLGMLSYALVTLLALKREAIQKAMAFSQRDFWQYVLVLVAAMFAFQAYLTLVEVFHLKTYCLVCLLSQAIVLALLVLAVRAWRVAE